MNSLEAIIVLTAMMAFTATMLTGISYYNMILDEGEETLNEKIISGECAIIIDSFFSNSASNYDGEFVCTGKDNFVLSEKKNKKTFVITTVKKEKKLEIKTNEHYK